MATINYSIDEDAAARYLTVEWSGISSGDEGEAFHCAGLRIASIHFHGTFSGGVNILATNETSPSAYFIIDSTSSARINLPAYPSVGYIKPNFPSGSGSLNVSILFLVR